MEHHSLLHYLLPTRQTSTCAQTKDPGRVTSISAFQPCISSVALSKSSIFPQVAHSLTKNPDFAAVYDAARDFQAGNKSIEHRTLTPARIQVPTITTLLPRQVRKMGKAYSRVNACNQKSWFAIHKTDCDH